jgi:Uma2 family endonuclease
VSGPLVLGPLSEPEPDLMLLALPAHRYRHAKPTAADVLLLIEVADSSLAYDRGAKLALYARFGIREVWIVDLEGRRLHVFREPDAAQAVYRDSHVLDPDDSATPEALPGIALGWGAALG